MSGISVPHESERPRPRNAIEDDLGSDENSDMTETCRSCLAIPGRIVELSAERGELATVEALGMRRKIDLTLIQDSQPVPGDWVLIHVGFAMSKISEQDALDRLRTLEFLEEKDAAAEELCGGRQGEFENQRDTAGPRKLL